MTHTDKKSVGEVIQPPTAGPWRVREHQTPGYERVISVSAGDLGICKVDGGGSLNPYVLAETRANAALIASAPDLLARAERAEANVAQLREALERLAKAVDDAASARGRMTGGEGRALESARAALAATDTRKGGDK